MKEGWTYKKFSELCYSISDGDWIEKKDQSATGIRLIQTGNIGVGKFIPKRDSSKFISSATFERLRCTEIFEGDILISRLPQPLGRSCILPKMDTRCITAVDCSILKIKKDIVVPQYFLYYTQSQNYFSEIDKQSSGTTRARITRKKLEETKIPLAPLSEQQRIVAQLDEAFAEIDMIKAEAEKQLSEAKALFQKALSQAMTPKEGWEKKKISEVGDVIGGTTPSTSNPNFWNGDICWISPAELHGERYLYDSVKKITKEAVKAKSLKELPEGTVILSSRAPIGKVAINKVPMYCNQGFKCVICRKQLYNEFLYWWFYGNTDYLNSLGTGATFSEISKTVVENISIPLPPLSEQQRIVEELDELSENVKEIEALNSKLTAECDAMKQALLRQVFE